MTHLYSLLIVLFGATAAHAIEPERTGPFNLRTEIPMRGCTNALPLYTVLSAECRALPKNTCNKHVQCTWARRSKTVSGTFTQEECTAKPGSYVTVPSPVPVQENGFVPEKRFVPHAATAQALNQAYDKAAEGNYVQAVAVYSRIINGITVATSDYYSIARTYRALAYEHMGNTDAALQDYCAAKAEASDWKAEYIARERVRVLTKADDAQKPVPRFIKNGVVRSSGVQGVARLVLTAVDTFDHLVKVVRAHDGEEEALIFVRAGTKVTVQIPTGYYHIHKAFGEVWYGHKDLFGPRTYYGRVRGSDGNDFFRFYKSGRVRNGHEVHLGAPYATQKPDPLKPSEF